MTREGAFMLRLFAERYPEDPRIPDPAQLRLDLDAPEQPQPRRKQETK